jgi:hypothetical protein
MLRTTPLVLGMRRGWMAGGNAVRSRVLEQRHTMRALAHAERLAGLTDPELDHELRELRARASRRPSRAAAGDRATHPDHLLGAPARTWKGASPRAGPQSTSPGLRRRWGESSCCERAELPRPYAVKRLWLEGPKRSDRQAVC